MVFPRRPAGLFVACLLAATAAFAGTPAPAADPVAAHEYFLKAREKEQTGDDAAALPLYRRAFLHDGGSRDLCFLYLDRLKSAGSIDSAAALGEKCAALPGQGAAFEYKLLGEIALRADNVPAALRFYREAHRLNEEDGDVLYVLAGLYEDAQDWEGYAAVVEKLLPRLDYPARLVERQLRAYERLNRPEAALPLLRDAWAESDQPSYGRALAAYYDSRGMYRSLLQVARRLREIEPGPEQDWMLARAYAAAGRPDSALGIYAGLRKVYPDNSDIEYYYVSLLFDQGRYAEALAPARKLARRVPESAEYAFLLGSTAAELRKSEAYPALERAVSLSPRSPEYRARLAYADYVTGSPQRASTRLGYAVTDSLGEEQALLLEGVAEGQLARMLEPREAWERPAAFSDSAAARRHRLRAVERLEKVLAGNSGNRAALFELGAHLERLGERDRALELLRRLVKKDTANAMALNYLGYMLVEPPTMTPAEGREAGDLLRRALALEPENGAYLDSRGWWWYREGVLDSARASLESAADCVPSDPAILGHLAEVLRAQGRENEACAAFLEIQRRDPDRKAPKECAPKPPSRTEKRP